MHSTEVRSTVWALPASAFVLLCVLGAAEAAVVEPPAETKDESITEENSVSSEESSDKHRVSVDVARERAKLAHNIYAATLDVLHHRYFREDRSTVPARAMEDLFSEIARQEHIAAKWISVNTRPMSLDHRPADDFEKQAAKVIKTGQHEYELVENGTYRRAEAISLMNKGCLVCHLSFGANASIERFAGLVITIPVTKD